MKILDFIRENFQDIEVEAGHLYTIQIGNEYKDGSVPFHMSDFDLVKWV